MSDVNLYLPCLRRGVLRFEVSCSRLAGLWASGDSPVSASLSCSENSGLHTHHCICSLWVPGSGLRSVDLPSRCSPHRAVSPAPFFTFADCASSSERCLSVPSVHLSLVYLGFSVWSSLDFLCMESLSTNMASVTPCPSGPAVLETGSWEEGGFVGSCLAFVGQERMSGKLTSRMYSWQVILSHSVEPFSLCCPFAVWLPVPCSPISQSLLLLLSYESVSLSVVMIPPFLLGFQGADTQPTSLSLKF